MEEFKKIMFQMATNKVMNDDGNKGFGTLKEKKLHRIIKNYLISNEDMHEVKVKKYIVDIFDGDEIFEIQTANFNKLRNKLADLLNDYTINVVFPIPYIKKICWMDMATGEITKPRISPKKGQVFEMFKEVYKIKQYLNSPNLHFKVMLINIIEYRCLNGWSRNGKKGSSRIERIPDELIEEYDFNTKEDYTKLVDFSSTFSSSDLKEKYKISISLARITLNILSYLKVIEKVGKNGNQIIYKKLSKDNFDD